MYTTDLALILKVFGGKPGAIRFEASTTFEI